MIKGKYIDEKIIKLRKVSLRDQSNYDIIVDKILIRGKWVYFIPCHIFDNKVTILVPDNFTELPEKIARIRYISQYRPPVIITSPNYSENLGYHLLERGTRNIEQSIEQMEESTLNHAPETIIYDRGSFRSDGLEGRWFDYKNFTVNDETYNLQFLIYTEHSILAGSFNCRMKFYDEWKEPILKSFEHITIYR